jgi:hypothetical protein
MINSRLKKDDEIGSEMIDNILLQADQAVTEIAWSDGGTSSNFEENETQWSEGSRVIEAGAVGHPPVQMHSSDMGQQDNDLPENVINNHPFVESVVGITAEVDVAVPEMSLTDLQVSLVETSSARTTTSNEETRTSVVTGAKDGRMVSRKMLEADFWSVGKEAEVEITYRTKLEGAARNDA